MLPTTDLAAGDAELRPTLGMPCVSPDDLG